MAGPRLLVIGRTGQLARALAEARADATFLGRDVLDLAVPGQARRRIAAARPEVIVNAAAYTAVDRAETERDLAFRINAEAVGEIAEAAAAAGAALVHLSTDYVYPGSKPAPHRETDPTGPVNVYGESKLAGERAALAACPRTLILRTSWVYAPWGRNFVRTMLDLAGRERLTVVDDQTGQPTSALDIADACLAIAPRLAAAGADAALWGPCHYAGLGATTWAGFASAIFAGARARGLVRRSPEIQPIASADYPAPARRPANSTLDCSRFERLFGRPTTPWPEALDRVIARIAAGA